MNKEVKKNILTLQGFYLLAFFAFGSLFPLLSVYLSETVGLNGYQIGTIMSVGPIVMIFFQPIWGVISDKTNAPTRVLSITTFLAGAFGLGYIFSDDYILFFITATAIAVFQSAIIPVSDSISLKYTSKVRVNYGNVRLFGSLGFGIAVFIMGRLSEQNPSVIFYAFFLALTLAALLAFRIPKEKAPVNKQLLSGVKEILTFKKFIIFLAITFLIFGPNLANNTYFGLFVEDSGGTYTGIGIAFLLAVLSEIPFMRLAGSWIDKFGLLHISALAGFVSFFRWMLYFFEPNLTLVYTTAVIQGFSLGLFIPAGLQYIREITPVHITATAVTLYSAIGNGFGNWFSTFFGGIIYEQWNIYYVYFFFGILALMGVILNIWLIKEEKDNATVTAKI
ncbi:MFS transporter [Bacillus canaveralius]|uniref:MFS transporter n=1 Tax=Bacillus canaveralius TaxID=1403243 RepID=A0A2N5GIJ4_9BACI|nr:MULTISPECIES: MFS transporter [Bacillus]PLR80818.1 MFS transporter [Bacillus canaveralius]PLR81926.1 MFS transporter [Bacillus sp. V33-4]PLR98305.1 MFS transporter [Bacillus canaveralius]RSK52974.1 MFS transporter [Bacillus canaveralius]